ncbi:antithrombin-III-like [Mytilus californianus]|uniref:antithrombin-III-like n=1 Tax=Mytilus californianus TaxID=6549 RepID=UPI0022481B0E|nr:antithrombin-III-like [Mytilus californianus]
MSMIAAIPVDYQQSLIEFSTSLYQGLDKQESVCLSPYSITAAFLLLMIGASGRSKQQISNAVFKNDIFSEEEKLKYYKSLNSYIIQNAGVNVSLASANRLFVNNKFTVLQNVRKKAKLYFGADISLKDFSRPKASAFVMNRWVSKQTNAKINDLINEDWLEPQTVMFIINAIYFKATWQKQFPQSSTRKQIFFLPNNKKIEVEMMNTKLIIPYFRGSDFSAIALPFEGGNFDMVFVLPHEIEGLPKIETTLTPELFKDISAGFNLRQVNVAIPKFKLESEFDLTKELPKLGVKDIFNDLKANFSNLITEIREGLYVKIAVHKCVFNVNEAGVEGAAGTAFGISARSSATQFTGDRPFLFNVRDIKSGLILFIGRFHPKFKV